MVIMGTSGCEYTVKKTLRNRYDKSFTVTVKNIKTGVTIFSIATRTNTSSPSAKSKNFLGFDDRYYHIHLSGSGGRVTFGQISTSGAVISTVNRTIIKHVSFYPIYQEGLKEAPPEPKIVIPEMPVIPISEAVISITTKPIEKVKEDLKWYEKIMQWIEKMIKVILNR